MYVDLHSQVLSGQYDVIQTGRGGRQRPGPSGSSFTAKDYQRIYGTKPPPTDGRKNPLKRLAPFIAGTITGFGLSQALGRVIAGGLTKGLILAAVAGAGSVIGSKTRGAPGTFAYGVALGSFMESSYEFGTKLKEIKDATESVKLWVNPGLSIQGPSGALSPDQSYSLLDLFSDGWKAWKWMYGLD